MLVEGVIIGATIPYMMLVIEDVATMYDPLYPHTRLLEGLVVAFGQTLGELPWMFMSGKRLQVQLTTFLPLTNSAQ